MLGNEEKQIIFQEIDAHLMRDSAPSQYIESISELPWFRLPPFQLLLELKKAKQSPEHHPEGSAWNHTMLVLDEAAAVKTKSSDPNAFMWAALLHDIGKPGTTRVRRGKITSYDHDKLGAKLVMEFFAELPAKQDLAEKVASLVRWHMQILFVVKGLPFADIEAMCRQADVNDVALLGLCDRMGRTGADLSHEEENIRIFLEKCALH